MSGADYTTTPNLGLFKPNYSKDVGNWGNHLNTNADILDAAVAAGGGSFLPLTGGTITAPDGVTVLAVNGSNTQPTTDHIHNLFTSTVNFTADATTGDTLGLVSYLVVAANGHAVPANTAGHTSAIYGNAFLSTPGTVGQINGVMGVSGNNSTGVLDVGVDFFGHPNYKVPGATINNHYFLYQEISGSATNEYGAYFSAPVGLGTTSPQFNLDLYASVGWPNFTGNWLRVGQGVGSLEVTNAGASFYPGYNPGAGGLGVQDLVVGTGGPNAVTATSGFLFISSCPGTPTAGPIQAAIGRVAVTYDTVAHKLWLFDGTLWRGVALT